MITEFDHSRQEWVCWVNISELKFILDHEDLSKILMEMRKILTEHNGETATPAPDTIAIQFNKKYV